MSKVVVVLQNPWAKGDLKNGFNSTVWKKEFLSSRTGKRLVKMLGTSDFRVLNANPTLTTHARDGAFLEPKSDLAERINRANPDFVILCGLLALESVKLGKLRSHITCIWIHHPSFRLFSNEDERRKGSNLRKIITPNTL